MHYEIERKFLVAGEYKHLAHNATRIAQGYFATKKGITVRVRIRGDKGYLTIKGPSAEGGLTRYEWEKEIPIDEARELMLLCEPGIIDKTRYLVTLPTDPNHTWEIDEFYGDNEGLTLAEIELGSETESFEKPAFIGREVTGDGRYYNKYMRAFPYKVWRDME